MATAIEVSPKKLQSMIQSAVRKELRELFSDPDFGLEIRESAAKRIRKSQRSKRAGKLRTAEEVIQRLGLGV
jgi:CRP-like cAMP-binding protein